MNEASKVKRDKYLIIKHGALGDILQGLDAFESLNEFSISKFNSTY